MAYIKFVVLTSSRTGSTWLMDLLNMQTGVEAHGELFLRHGRLSPAIAGRADFRRFIEVYGTPGLKRVPRVFSYLSELYRPKLTIGFKLMYTHLRNYPEIVAYLTARRVRVVHLMRRNHIDVIVSEELARLTGKSHVKAGTTTNIPMVHLDPATLVDRIRSLSRKPGSARQLIRLSFCPVLEVTYEALLEADQEFLRICEFLEIPRPATQVQSKLAKRGIRSHRDSIVNYEEVRRILSPTPFSSMLR
jgi:LPS sulfotransferase NodH